MECRFRRATTACSLIMAAIIVFCGASPRVSAAPGDLLYVINDPDLAPFYGFGFDLAASEDTVLIGASDYPEGDLPFVGRAYAFDASTGELRHRILAPEPEDRPTFGRSVAIAGSRLVIGSQGRDGAAYVFSSETGAYERKIENPAEKENATFTSGLAAVGDNVIIGSPQHDVDGVQAGGAAFLASPATGEILHTYENPEPTTFAGFGGGGRVAANSNRVFVAEPLDRGPDGWAWGAVWAYDKATGNSTLRIRNPSPDTVNVPPISDQFGHAIVSNDDILVVASPLDDPFNVQDAGTVYVFDAATGSPRITIPNPEPGLGDEFGFSVAVIGDDILIGADGDNENGVQYLGAAYLFDGWTGQLLLTLRHPEPEEYDFFGYVVTAAGGKLFVSAPGDVEFGEVFAFEGMPERIPGDTNRDGSVDLNDLNQVRNEFGTTGYGMYGDLDRDGIVGLDDLNAVRNHFGDAIIEPAVPEPATGAILAIVVVVANTKCIRGSNHGAGSVSARSFGYFRTRTA